MAFAGHGKEVKSVAFAPDGKTLATGSGDRTVTLWDTASGMMRRSCSGHQASVTCVAFSPDGKCVLSGCSDGTIFLFD